MHFQAILSKAMIIQEGWIKVAIIFFFLKKSVVLYLKKCQFTLLKILCAKFGFKWSCVFWKARFKMPAMYFRYFINIPLGKWCGPSFDQIWLSFTEGCFVPSLTEIHPVVLGKTSDRQTVGRTTDDQKSSEIGWAKNKWFITIKKNRDIHLC